MYLQPLVSVIVPNYNHEKFLKKRLDSVFGQTYKNIEVILLDDCSDDNSLEILNKYRKHSKVSFIGYNAKNSGAVINQWIKGLEECRGEYVWIAESDDFSDENFIEVAIEPMLKDKEIVLSYVHSNVVDENNNIIHQLNYSHEEFSDKHWKNSFIESGMGIINQYLIFRNIVPNVSSAIFKKEILDKNVRKGLGYVKFADWIVYYYILLEGKIAFNYQELNYFREHLNTTRTHSVKNTYLIASESIRIRNTIVKNNKLLEHKVSFQNWKISKQQFQAEDLYNRLIPYISESEILLVSPFNNYTKHFIDTISSKKLKLIKEIIDSKAEFSCYLYRGIPVVSVTKSNWIKKCKKVIIFSDNYAAELKKIINDHVGYNINIKTISEILREIYDKNMDEKKRVSIKYDFFNSSESFYSLIKDNGFDYIDFGCSKGGSLLYAKQVFLGKRGLGIDINQDKINIARNEGLDAIIFDINDIPNEKLVRFVIMSHFLEHVKELKDVKGFIKKACTISTDFIYIQQPFFDSDGYLLRNGLKLFWSDWKGHPNRMSSLDMWIVLRDLCEEGFDFNYSIHFRGKIIDSSDVSIHSILSPIDQHKYDVKKHPEKPMNIVFKEPVYSEIKVLISMPGIDHNELLKRIKYDDSLLY